jgi:hypothetical protein
VAREHLVAILLEILRAVFPEYIGEFEHVFSPLCRVGQRESC